MIAPKRLPEVGDRERGHAVGGRRIDGRVDTRHPVDDRVLAVQAEVDEAGSGHCFVLRRHRKFYTARGSLSDLAPVREEALQQFAAFLGEQAALEASRGG